jgi:putative ABC transport system permease protein
MGRVDAAFFDALDVRLLGGRTFGSVDFTTGATAAIVNRSFVQQFLGGGNALGRQVRAARADSTATTATQRWEIVGVVDDFPARKPTEGLRPKMYLPLRLEETYPITLGVRVRSVTTTAASERIRAIGVAVDPTLRFASMRTLGDLLNEEIKGERMAILALVALTLSVVLLSAAGIYALMSFTVTRRHREIGIRMALGAHRGQVVAGILGRAMRQIGIGIAIGVPCTIILGRLAGDTGSFGSPILLLKIGGMMAIVGLIATIGPARRVLRVQPTEALRAE